jgi:hypothetical protein
MHHDGVDTSHIAAATGLTTTEIETAVANAAAIRQASTHPVRSAPGAPTAAPPVQLVRSDAAKAATAPRTRGTITELLSWAQRHDDTRLRAAARRILDGLDDLRSRRATEEAARDAAAAVERLTAELRAAKQHARATGAAISTPPDLFAEATDAEIRRWAADLGRRVPRYGPVPQRIRDDYYDAHPDLATAGTR